MFAPRLRYCDSSNHSFAFIGAPCVNDRIIKIVASKQAINCSIDLLQVDLLASGAGLVWPRSGRPRVTKSREVDLSRLMGCHLHFAPKMGSSVTRIWGFRTHLRILDFMAECAGSTPTESIERVCVSVRTNSSAKCVYENIYNFKKRLRARGYPRHNLIEKITTEVNSPNGSQLYKTTMKCEKKILPFVTRRTILLCRTLNIF